MILRWRDFGWLRWLGLALALSGSSMLGSGGPPWPVDVGMMVVGLLVITLDNSRRQARLDRPEAAEDPAGD